MTTTEKNDLQKLLLQLPIMKELIEDIRKCGDIPYDDAVSLIMEKHEIPIDTKSFWTDTKKGNYSMKEFFAYDRSKTEQDEKVHSRYQYGCITDVDGDILPYFIPSDHYLQFYIAEKALSFVGAAILPKHETV